MPLLPVLLAQSELNLGWLTQKILGATLSSAEWVLWLLCLLSIASVAIMLERALYFTSHRLPESEALAVKISRGELDSVLRSVGDRKGMEAAILREGVSSSSLGADTVEEVVAATIARRMVVPPQRDGGQRQYIDQPIPVRYSEGFAPQLDWMLANLDKQHTVAALAARANGWLDRAAPQIGSMLGRLVRAEDTPARLSPDVFAIALPAARRSAAQAAAERIAAVIACTAFDAGEGEPPFTVEFEIGAAEIREGENPVAALERAASLAQGRAA